MSPAVVNGVIIPAAGALLVALVLGAVKWAASVRKRWAVVVDGVAQLTAVTGSIAQAAQATEQLARDSWQHGVTLASHIQQCDERWSLVLARAGIVPSPRVVDAEHLPAPRG